MGKLFLNKNENVTVSHKSTKNEKQKVLKNEKHQLQLKNHSKKTYLNAFCSQIEGNKKQHLRIQHRPQNFYNKQSHQFEPIDTRCIENETGFDNTTNTFQSHFFKNLQNQSIFTVNDQLNLKMKNALPQCSGQIQENKILYSNIQDGVDLCYSIESNQIKEQIIIQKKLPQYAFEFELDIKDLQPVYHAEKNCIQLLENGKEKYSILSPYMEDANHKISEECSYEIEQKGTSLKIICKADKNWIESEERVFPVIIDPTIQINDEDPYMDVSYNKTENGEFKSNSSSFVGYAGNCFYQMDISIYLEEIRKTIQNRNIQKITLNISIGSKEVTNTSVPLVWLISDINEQIDCALTNEKTLEQLDLTEIIAKRLDQIKKNETDTSTLSLTLTINQPVLNYITITDVYLELSEENSRIVKPQEFERTYDVKKAGTYYWNYGRSSYFKHNDTIIQSKELSVPIYHVFNESTKDYSNDFIKINFDQKINTQNFHCGKGWKTSLHQNLLKDPTFYPLIGGYITTYIDGTGGHHEFYEKWYYKDTDETKKYLKKEEVFISDNLKLSYMDANNVTHEVFYEVLNDEDLTFINGTSLRNYRQYDSFTIEQEFKIKLHDGVLLKLEVIDGKINLPHFKTGAYENTTLYIYDYTDIIQKSNGFFQTTDGQQITVDYRQTPILFDGTRYYTYGFKTYGQCYYEGQYPYGTKKVRLYVSKKTTQKNFVPLNDVYINEDIETLMNQLETIKNQEKDLILQNKIIFAQTSDLFNQLIAYENNTDGATIIEDQINQKLWESEIYQSNYYQLSLQKAMIESKYEYLIQLQKEQLNYYISDKDGNLLGFDGFGRLVLLQDKKENQIQILYGQDEDQDKILEVQGEKETIRFLYNDKDLLSDIIDANGKKLSFLYDTNSRIKMIYYPALNHSKRDFSQYQYNSSNQLIQVIDYSKRALSLSSGIKMTVPVATIQDEEIETTDEEETILNETMNGTSTGLLIYDQVSKKSTSLSMSTIHPYQSYFENGKTYHRFFSKNKLLFDVSGKKTIPFTTTLQSNTYEATITIVDQETTTQNQFYREKLSATDFYFLQVNIGTNTRQNLDCSLKIIVNYPQNIKKEFSLDYEDVSYNYLCLPFICYRSNAQSIQITIECSKTPLMIQPHLYMASGFIYEYDDQDRLTRQFNGIETIEYLDYVDDLPMQINITDQYFNTKIQRYFYDDKRNIVLEMNKNGYCKEYFRNEDTNLTEIRSYHKDQPTLYYATKTQTDITNHTSTEYTGFFDNGVEQKVIYSYHPNQNVDQMIDANGQIYRYGYDPLNEQQLEFSTLYHGALFSNQMHYQNDLMTRLSHEGTNYYFDYDGQDRLTKIRIGNQQQVSIAYNLSTDGKTYTTTKSFANGYQFVQQVDQDGKIKNKNYGGTNLIYTYNEEDLLTKKNTEFETFTFSYDADNLLLSQSFSCPYQTVSESYEYEKQRLISSTFLYNNQETTTTYTYDDQDRLSSALFSQVYFAFDFDNLSRINQEKIITQSNLTLEKNKKYLHTPATATDFIKEEEIIANGQLIAHYQYQYTPGGNLLSIENEGKTITYHYDELHRLIREDNPYMNQTYTFQYDGAGNILSKKEYAYSLQSHLSQPNQIYTYLYQNTQWKDQLTKITTNDSSYTITYDTMGYPTSIANHTLTWNKKGTLYKWDQTTYEYNIENQLIRKVGNGITTNYYAINHKIHQINIGTNILKFFYALDKLVYFTYNGTRYFYVFNAQNDITHLVDDTGTVVASYIYDAWGNHQVFDASGIENTSADFIGNINPYRYRGYLYDTDSGLYYCNARYYSPDLCRWISPDSIEYLDSNTIGGLNLYCYCMNDPINYMDPSGHFGIGLTLLIATGVGLAFGFGIEVAKQAYNGGDWNWDLNTWNWWEIGRASLIGATTGFAYGLGGVAGGIIKGSFQALTIAGKALTVSQSVGLLLGTVAVTNFAAGIAGYAMYTAGSETESFNILKGISEGIGQTGKGVLSFFTAGMYVGSGFWKVGVGAKNTFSSILGRTAGRFIANYVSNYMFENLF